MVSTAKTPAKAVEDAYKNHLWSKAPDFDAVVTEIHFH
jgi:hypothetical protein